MVDFPSTVSGTEKSSGDARCRQLLGLSSSSDRPSIVHLRYDRLPSQPRHYLSRSKLSGVRR